MKLFPSCAVVAAMECSVSAPAQVIDATPSVKGNPFDTNRDTENHLSSEICSYGHRNPQALAVHPVTGDLWSSEHGPQGGDEVNLIRRGATYGRPLTAYGTEYDGSPIHNGRTQFGCTEQPRYYWDPSIAPGGMTFDAGNLIAE